MEREERTDRFAAVEDRFAGYTVYDQDGDKIGKVDDLFLDEQDQPEYVGVKMGFFGLSSTLVPMDAVRVDEGSQALYVQAEKETVKNGPRFDDDNEITPDFERQVREYYGLDVGASNDDQPEKDVGLDRLLDEWMADESGYDENTWPGLKEALDQNRQSSGAYRKLFVD